MGAAQLLPAFGAPEWTIRMFVVCAWLGLPIAIVLAWAYEITPRGIVRDVADTDSAEPAASPDTTLFADAQGTVRVAWHEGGAHHEKIFSRGFRIGRDVTCEVRLDDPMISRHHAEITRSDGHWWIHDLGSRNGTLVNGERIARVPLPTHCEVRLYETAPVLRLEVRASPTASTVTSSRIHRASPMH
jgi:pSer/pThr/pTyr-binding forkhead associated (FHA) protein